MAEVSPQVRWGKMDLVHELGTAVDDSHNVFQIMAHAEVVLAASMKRGQLCGQKVRRSDDADFISADFRELRTLEGGVIPAVSEAEYGRVRWHQVENQVSIHPTANRCPFSVRLL